MTVLEAVALAGMALALINGWQLVTYAATHEHQPSPHYNQRCPICGLAVQES